MTAGWLDDVRGRPDAAALARVAEAIAPGSRIAGVRRLGGGLGAAMDRFDLLAPDGERQKLVLRRYPRRAIEEEPELPERAWRTLGVLEPLGVSGPRPVWADLDGALFGTPAFVMTRLSGRSDLLPRDLDGWLRQFAGALAALHRTRTADVDLGFLRGPEESLERNLGWAMAERNRENPQGAVVQETLTRWRPRLRRMTPVFSHGDFWAGNTLWQRGRLTAIVDWDSARIAYPGMDVGYCRMDLAIQYDTAVADRFLQMYEAAAGMRIPQLFFWDLLGASVALPDPERWLPGFHELGRDDVTPLDARTRLAAFISQACRVSGVGNGE